MQVLIISSEWPSPQHPDSAPFIVNEVQCLRRAGIKLQVFPFRGNQNPFTYLRSWLRLRQTYSLARFDLIHAHFGQSGLLALPAKIPLVVTFHGSDLQGIVGANGRYTLAGRVLQLAVREVSKRAQVGILSAEHLRKFLPPTLKVKVIPPGIDLDLFRPMSQREARKQLGLPRDRRLVLFGAHPYNPVKRYHLTEEAVGLLHGQFEVDLVVLSGVSPGSVPLYMNACDALVLTSRHEGSPTVIKEALACNLPVVSVNVGDVAQRLAGVAGCVLCRDDAPQTIAEGLSHVLKDCRRIQGREAVGRLDIRLAVREIIGVYGSVLNEGNR